MKKLTSVDSIMSQVQDIINNRDETDVTVSFLELEKLTGSELNNSISYINHIWEIPGEIQIIGGITFKEKIKAAAKRFLNRLINWRIIPLISFQKEFNATTVRILNSIYSEMTDIKKQLEEKQEKIEVLEKVNDDLLSQINSKSIKDNDNEINYLHFENFFRGNKETVKKFQSIYLEYLNKDMKVLDLGCGRGEFIEILNFEGIDVIGVDSNKDMAEYCKSKNLNVIHSDIFDFLGQTQEKFDCIFISQVVEHLPASKLIQLIGDCYKVLNDEGIIIIETPNPETILVSAYTFYLDTTHIKPIPSIYLKYLLNEANFNVIDILYLHPFPQEELLLEYVGENHEINLNFNKLNKLLYGPRDYSIIASKKVGELI